MEFLETAILISMAFIFSVSGIFIFKKIPFTTKNNRKKSKETTLEEVTTSQIRTIQESYEARIKQQRDEITSLQRSNSRLKGLYKKYQEAEYEDNDDNDDYENLLTQYDIDWTKAVQVGKQMGLAVENFDPNDNATKEVIQSQILKHKDVAFALGVIKPRGQVATQQTSNQSDEIDTLVKEIANQGGNIA